MESDWRDHAACEGMGTYYWFGDHVCNQNCEGPEGCYEARRETGRFARVEKARSICGSCKVSSECLAYALLTRQPHGIWGGLTERERRPLLKQLKKESA